MKFFEQMLVGSASLNQKLADIDRYGSAILPLVNINYIRDNAVVEALNGECHWILRRHRSVKRGYMEKHLAIELYAFRGLSDKVIFSTNPLSQCQPTMADVDFVYRALEDLTEYLLSLPEGAGFKTRTTPLFEEAARIAEAKAA